MCFETEGVGDLDAAEALRPIVSSSLGGHR
jgi:hypothetical protein